MARNEYGHSAYWYAKKGGWTHSEHPTLTGQYLDIHGCLGSPGPSRLDVNPLLLGALAAADMCRSLRETLRRIADPAERDRMKREFLRDIRRLRRPVYYARETERRRQLAADRRKVVRRAVDAPKPEPAEILAAWNARKTSRAAAIRLGGLLDTLSCHVDSCLRFDESGNVAGRNGGIRGWLRACLPELAPKYKTLMRYKALATRLRQLTDTRDPVPASRLLEEPLGEAVARLLAEPSPAFARLFEEVDRQLSPEAVFLDAPPRRPGRARKGRPPAPSEGRTRSGRENSALNSHLRSRRDL